MNDLSSFRTVLRNGAQAGLLLGTWRLVGMTTRHAGRVDHPLGLTPSGEISYAADGRMAVHLCKDPAGDQPAMPDYTAYCGRYTLDLATRSVVHHVEASSIPGLAGSDQVRGFDLEGDLLRLRASSDRGDTVLEWRRVAADNEPPAGFERLEAPGAFPNRAGRFWIADRGSDSPLIGTRIGVEQSNSEGFAHGGFLLAFADFAITIVIRGITLNLSTDFIRPARIGDWVEARIVTRKRTADLIFADAVATVEKRDALRVSGLFRPFEITA